MRYLIAGLLLMSCLSLSAQHSDDTRRPQRMQAYQDSLLAISSVMFNHELEPERYNANYRFIKTLVNALKETKSFQYGFDSLKTISVLHSPDRRFRIFSWHIMNDDGSYRYYGAIQMNTPEGKLKLYPLVDSSPLFTNPADTVTTANKWYGAQYYQMAMVSSESMPPYYVLLGWKGNTTRTTKKVIEVLYFKEDNAYFGSSVFDGNSDNSGKKRIIFEYARDASLFLQYYPAQQRIVFDHLAPQQAELKGDFSKYGPDMTHDAYQLQRGRWKFQPNLILKNPPSDKDDLFNDPKKLKSNQPIRKY